MKNNYLINSYRANFLSPVMFFALTLVTTNSWAQNMAKVSIKNEKWEKGGVYQGYSPSQEILEKRSKTTKHFKNGDGTFTAQIGVAHYQDLNGVWQDIDYSITANDANKNFKFSNETNEIKSYFPENSGSKSVLMKSESGINLSWWKSPSLKLTSNGSVLSSFSAASKNGSVKGNSIVYNNVYPNISEEFQILPGGMENNTIINSLDAIRNLPTGAMMEFSQIIELKKGWKVNANGRVQSGSFESKDFFISIPGQNDVLNFSPIIVFDNNLSKNEVLNLTATPKEKLTSDQKARISEYIFQCNYVAEITSEGLKITTKLPVSWLTETKRAFPVTIDPTVTIGALTTGNFYGPITHWYGFQRHADLYLQSEVGVYGTITAIEYYKTGVEGTRTKPTKVYMKSTAATSLTGTAAWNSTTYTGGLTPVFDATTTQDNVPGWKMITLASPFNYSSGNLLLMVYDEYGGSGNVQYFAQAAVNNRQAFNRADGANPGDAAATAVESVLPSVRITYSAEPPAIASFTPDSGCSETGNVTITGTGFAGVTSVTIGGTAVASFTINSGTQITATVGSGTTGPIVVTNSYGSATSTANFTVNASPALAANAGGSATVCIGAITTFTNATTGGTWSVVPGTGSATVSATGVVTGVTAGTVSVVYSVSNSLCTITSSSPVTVNSLPNAITVTASSAICAGEIKQLNVTGAQSNVVAIIGSGTALTGATDQPTAFCNRWPSYWSQTIYTAAELIAAGYGPGIINSMAYNINSLGDAATNANFTVKIGTIASTTFSSTTFVSTTAFTNVYGPSNYTHTATGWQEIVFTTPYVWDGVSNIVINVTHSGANDIYNSQTYYTENSGNTTIWQRSITGTTVSGSFSANRLNIRFTGVKSTPVTWTPTAGLYTNAAATTPYTGTDAQTVYAKPTVTTQYVAAATNAAGCSATAVTDITVNPASALPVATSPQNFTTGQTLANLVVAGTGLIWYSAATGTAVLPATTPLVEGTTYYVSQTESGSCEGPRLPITVQESLSSPSFDNDNFQAYPNPVKNFLNLSYTQDISEVSVFNLVGQKVLSKKINTAEGQIDMTNLAQGTYLLKVSVENQVKTIKVVKE